MNDNLIAEDKLGSDEWSAVDPTKDTPIPTFGIEEPADAPPPAKTDAEIETERLAAEAAAATGGKTDAEIETERLAAEALANAGKTPEQIAQEQKDKETKEQEAAIQAQKDEMRKQLLAEMGVESIEDIKKLKNPDKPETEDEKKVRLEKQEASFHQYAVTHDKMSLGEINTYKQLAALPAKDLVYADFANEYKAANADRKDEDKEDFPVTNEEIDAAFDKIYHTGSEDAVAKKAGERALNARAKEILSEPEKKYNAAKDEYEFLANRAEKMPEFKAFVQTSLKEAIPEKKSFTVDGHEFNVELDGKDFAEIEEKFKNDNVFGQFIDTKDRQGLKTSITEEAARQLSNKYEAKVAEIAFKSGHAAGLKEGKVGARAPFVRDAPPAAAPPNSKLTADERAQIREGHTRV